MLKVSKSTLSTEFLELQALWAANFERNQHLLKIVELLPEW
jgi:hypothetical protein